MKTFIILQNVASFRIHWSCLYQPKEYRLVLITSSINYERLIASEQNRYFNKVICTDSFDIAHLIAITNQIRQEFSITDLHEVRIVTHDEYSLAVAASLRKAIGIEGARPKELRSFVNKVTMKRVLGEKGIRIPRHLEWEPERYQQDAHSYLAYIEQTLALPVFVKPVDESGSVGTAKLETREQLTAWGETHRIDTGYEMDEWIEGTLYHCDSITRDGQLLYTHVCEYAHPCYDYLSGKICGSITLAKESETFRQLAHFTERILKAISPMPRDTVTHLEVFRKLDGELIFLEIAARAPAAMVPFTYEKHLGLNIEEVHIRLHMGLFNDFELNYGPYSAFVYFPHRQGTVTALHQPDLHSESIVTWKINVGDQLTDPDNIRDAACSVLLWNEDYDELRRDFEYLDHFTAYSVDTTIPTVQAA